MANDVRISVSVDNNTSRGLDAIRASIAELRAEAARNIHVTVDADVHGVASAEASLTALRELASRNIHTTVDVDTHGVASAIASLAGLRAAASVASTGLGTVGSSAGSASGSVTGLGGALSGLGGGAGSIVAIASALALIAPMAAVAAGGIALVVAEIAAAGAGVGIFALAALPALSQVSNALKLHTAAQKENTAATTAAVGPNYALINAKRSLADAVRSASRSIVDADEALADAEKQLGRVARQNAQDIAAAKKQVVQAQESEASAERNLTDANKNAVQAQKALNDARKEAADDLKALNDQLIDSQLATEDATLRVQDAQEQLNATLKDPTASNLKRQEAQLAVAEAQQALKEQIDANNKLKQSSADQVKAGVEGSQKVIDAKQKVSDAAQQQADAEQQVADAQQGVRDAVQGVADAQVQASERMADAQEQVADAARNVARAHEDAASSIASAQAAVAQAMQKTSAATGGAETAAQKYQDALNRMSPSTRALYENVLKLKDGFKKWADSLAPVTNPVLTDFVGLLLDLLPKLTPIVTAVAGVLKKIVDGLDTKLKNGDFDQFFSWLASFSAKSIEDIATAVGHIIGWIKDVVVSKTFQDFMGYVKDNGPVMAKTLEDFATAVGHMMDGLAPLAKLSFKALDGFFEVLGSIPKDVWTGIALGMMALAVALGIVAVVALPIIGTIAGVILAFAELGVAAVELYKHWNTIWNFIKKVAGDVYHWLRDNVFKPLINFFTKTIPGAATALWKAIKDAFNQVKKWVADGWKYVKDKSNDVVSFFKGLPRRIASATKGIWNPIKNGFRAMINGIIDLWNRLHLPLKVPSNTVTKLLHISGLGFNIETPNVGHLAHGGISGGGLTMVGENGPELVHLPAGSHVSSNPDSQRHGNDGRMAFTFYFEKSGDPTMDLFIDQMKNRIRVKHGGNVDVALGK